MLTFGSRTPNSSGLRCEAFRPRSTPPATPIAAVAAGITTRVTVARVPLRDALRVPFVVAVAGCGELCAAFEREPAVAAREPLAVRFAVDLALWPDEPLRFELDELLRERDAGVPALDEERALVPLALLFEVVWRDDFADLVVAISLPPFCWASHRRDVPKARRTCGCL